MRVGQLVTIPIRQVKGCILLVIPDVLHGETVYIVKYKNEEIPCFASDVIPEWYEAEAV